MNHLVSKNKSISGYIKSSFQFWFYFFKNGNSQLFTSDKLVTEDTLNAAFLVVFEKDVVLFKYESSAEDLMPMWTDRTPLIGASLTGHRETKKKDRKSVV